MRLILLFLWLPFASVFAQNAFPRAVCASTCAGALGENIFPDGDFGSGVPNILPNNPGIAPGYSYATNPPPNDGSYTITNNTTTWGSYASDRWINIYDNSGTQTGYMMVVNAAYEPGLFYEKTVAVCENTLYEFSADLVNLIEPNVPNHILPNVAFLIDGQEVCASGNVAQDATWKTYRFSFTTAPGVTQAKLALRNNAPGGIGNDIALDNISFRACGPIMQVPDTAFFCEGQPLNLGADLFNSPYTSTFYQWQTSGDNGQTWANVAGASTENLQVPSPTVGQLYRLVAANSANNLNLLSCRSVSPYTTLALDDLSAFQIAGPDTIVCNGAPAQLEAGTHASYLWSTGATTARIEAGAPGIYAVDILSKNNCPARDEILVYEVNLAADATWEMPICHGDSTGSILGRHLSGGVGSIRYALSDGATQSSPAFEDLPAGNFLLSVKDSLGCAVEIPIELIYPDAYALDLGPDVGLIAFDTLPLRATYNYLPVQYAWSPAQDLSCSDCPEPLAFPLQSRTYHLRVRDDLGCVAEDSLRVTVSPNLDFYAPNIFSPAMDARDENSFFTLYTSRSSLNIKQFAIFDRWGNLVFLRENTAPGDQHLRWDGTTRTGKNAPAGVYIWMATVEYSEGVARRYTGDVTLLR
jgi:hypothetical protein